MFGEPVDIAFAFAPDGAGVADALVVRSDDHRIVREAHVTAYHVLWELVHVFLDVPEVLA